MRKVIVADIADTRLFLFGLLRELSQTNKKLRLKEHASTVLFNLATHPGGRSSYSAVRKACKLSAGQMASAVRSLVKAGAVQRAHDPVDHRRLELAMTKKGQAAYDALFIAAQSHDDK